MNNTEKERLRLYIMELLKGDFDKFDFEHEIDMTLNFLENKNILLDKIDLLRDKEISKKAAMDSEMAIKLNGEIGTKLGLKEIFDGCRVVGLAGNRNSGKTNNLIYLLMEFRKVNKTPIYAYGFPLVLSNPLKSVGIRQIDSLKQLINKRDCIVVVEEMQRLKLNDRRYRDIKNEFMDFVYHNNIYCILSSPNLREFNSIIGSSIERWLLKAVDIHQCVNGSQLKEVVDSHKGAFKELGSINVPNDKLLLINENEQIVINCDYVEWADTKKGIKPIW